MKWVAGSYRRKLAIKDRRAYLVEWHRWYAWRPAYIKAVEEGKGLCPAHYVWLEYVDRKITEGIFTDPFAIQALVWLVSLMRPITLWNYRPYTGGYEDTKEALSSRVRATSRVNFPH